MQSDGKAKTAKTQEKVVVAEKNYMTSVQDFKRKTKQQR